MTSGSSHTLVVPITARVAEVDTTGIQVGGQSLGVRTFGGLLGIDGVHFTDTGYGVLADVFVDTASEYAGVSIDPIDLEALVAQDPESPDALVAAGIPLDECDVP